MPRPLSGPSMTRQVGPPIVVVSGLPRSGTSMMMRMLESGGLEVVTDGVRIADESNPGGYYECERVKTLAANADTSWLETARGKGIKIISFLLKELPETNDYRVIFMHRDLDEIMASQRTMLRATGEPEDQATDARLAIGYQRHLNTVKQLIVGRPGVDLLDVHYADVLDHPREQAERVNAFLGLRLDVSRMAAAVDRALHRNRR